MVGISDYKTGTKNNWRRRSWNEIARRVKDKKNATVLYLAAEQDLDRAVAVSKGFCADNLISVDMRKEVVDKHRSDGKLSIHGKINEILAQYIDGVDVLVGDFCSGLTQDVADTFSAAIVGGFVRQGGVALFNIQRGRERDLDWLYIEEILEALASTGIKDKHRGVVLWNRHILEGFESHKQNVTFEYFRQYMNDRYMPTKTSYPSSVNKALKFDTLIVSQPYPFTNQHRKIWSENYFNRRDIARHTRNIAATKAIATMRKTGNLPHSPRW